MVYRQGEDENVMNILVASDIHVGYKEKDAERGKDSFDSLEEIFMIAKQKKVDFILLGGDLFHENKPSRKTLHSTMELFRKYCLGDRPCQIEVVSDQAINFGHTSSSITSVNYENPHMNIGMPVFSIHGNHDDPTGAGGLSAIDLLSVAGLLNHFGKQTNLDKIDIQPVLLQKGTTKLALYGLGSTRDERLHRLFLNKNVSFFRPQENIDDWFNIFVLHQNRAKHGATNYIPEEFIDEFIDLVMWGHEHECRIDPEFNQQKKFYVMQPGSPVATSLCAAESKPKHVALLKIHGREWKAEKISLQTPRQMFVEDVMLADHVTLKGNKSAEQTEQAIRTYCKGVVESLIQQAHDEHTGHPKQPKKPLIRVRVDYSGGFGTFNSYRFGAEFADRVANQENIVHFLKKSVKRENSGIDVGGLDAMINSEVVEKIKIADLVQQFLDQMDKKDRMTLLTARGVSAAVSEFVDKHEKEAINELCKHQIEKTKQHVLDREDEIPLERDSFISEVCRFHEERESQERSRIGDSAVSKELEDILNRAKREGRVGVDSSEEEGSTASAAPAAKPKRGASKPRGRGGRGKKSAQAPTRPAGRQTMDAFFQPSQSSRLVGRPTDDDDVMVVEQSSSPAKAEKRPIAKRGRNKGVVYVSSDDEGENPFAKKRKPR